MPASGITRVHASPPTEVEETKIIAPPKAHKPAGPAGLSPSFFKCGGEVLILESMKLEIIFEKERDS